ncbi:hypothetical protein ElyMa_001788400 [Elysia marginata]|uniref:Uncharacterized protein n=1 Tax=Elysia marginata TaxID=1093978 RepID=A0AAV4EED6_9GAST|nr:hypothetical protein ElyMa_001788400 [Elysia marginata]
MSPLVKTLVPFRSVDEGRPSLAMDQVLEGPISDQLAKLQQQEESLIRREELVREMEIAQREAKGETRGKERGTS